MKIHLPLLLILIISACKFEIPGADEKFGRQNFVSAIAIIELHKTRNGLYPQSLKELKFLGDWDAIWLTSVRYEKVDGGYNLFVEKGFSATPVLQFPIAFKKGLGIKKSNVSWVSNTTES